MMISYKWQILEGPLKSEEQQSISLQNILPIPIPSHEQLIFNNQSLNTSMHPLTLKCPIFAFIFSFYIEEPKNNQPQIQLVPQLLLFDQKIQINIIKHIQTQNHVYMVIQIENCQIYDHTLTLMMRIQYHGQDHKNKQVNTIQDLIKSIANQQLNNNHINTYATIKKQLILEEPIQIQYRYQYNSQGYNNVGYIWMKITKPEESYSILSTNVLPTNTLPTNVLPTNTLPTNVLPTNTLPTNASNNNHHNHSHRNNEFQICEIEMMNWLAVNSNQSFKKEVINCTFMDESIILKDKEAYVVMFMFENELNQQVQIPYFIKYKIWPYEDLFKIVKIIKIDKE